MYVEVKGIEPKLHMPQILTFDGHVFEAFKYLGTRIECQRYHLHWIEKFEVQEKDGKSPVLYMELNFQNLCGRYEFETGGDNIYELVEAVNQAMP